MKIFKYLAALLLLPTLAYAQPLGGAGNINGVRLFENGSYVGECAAFDFFRGFTLTNIGGTCSVDNAASMVNARKYLNCDGVTPDNIKIQALVGTGGPCAGKTCIFDAQCPLYFITPNTSAGGGTVAVPAPGTKLIGNTTIKLAGRSCTGGLTPGAACPGGVSDCNGGTCDYDDTVNSKEFAWNAADTYKIFASTVKNSNCTALNTPYSCCREGTGKGVCDLESPGYEISGFTIAARQIENYGRCNNSGAEQAKACNPYCAYNASLPNANCSKDADCGGTCVGAATCPSLSSIACTSIPFLTITGPGSIFIADFDDINNVKISNIKVTDFYKGQGIAAGVNAEISNINMSGWSGDIGISSTPNFLNTAAWWPLNITSSITSGITAETGARISDAKLRLAGSGIVITNKLFSGNTFLIQPTSIVNSFVYVWANSATGIGSTAPYTTITNNHVEMTGNSNEGIYLSANTADYSTISRNSVVLNGGTTGGRAIDSIGDFVAISDNVVTASSALSGVTAYKAGAAAGGQGFYTRFHGNQYTVSSPNSYGVEFYGGNSEWVGGTGVLATGSGQHVNVAGDQHKLVADSYFGSGATCIAPDPAGLGNPTNNTITGNRCYGQSGTAMYITTGWILTGNYIAWMGVTGIVLGDDRIGSVLAPSGHAVITGNQLFSATNNQSLIKFPALTTGVFTQNIVITGNLFHGTAANLIGVDLGTGYSGTSTPIDTVSIIGNNFTDNTGTGIGINFPTAGTSRVTNISVGPNQYITGLTGVKNYLESFGPRIPYETLVVNDSVLGSNTANFMPVSGFLSTAITANTGIYQTFQAGEFGIVHCDIDTAGGSSKTRTVSLDVAGVSQKTCAMANPAITCDSAAAMTPVTANQLVRYSLANTAAVAASGIACRVRFYPSIF